MQPCGPPPARAPESHRGIERRSPLCSAWFAPVVRAVRAYLRPAPGVREIVSTSATTTGAYTPSMYSIGRTGANLRRRALAAGPPGFQGVGPPAPAAARHPSAITISGGRVRPPPPPPP